jgi:predicted oxidoreductase
MDQADIYGGYMAEEVLGNALKGTGLREQIEIVTKCDIVAPAGRHAAARVKYYDTSRAHITASVDTSLQLMGIDYIDVLLIHRPDREKSVPLVFRISGRGTWICCSRP